MKKVLIIGAASAMAEAIARKFSKEEYCLFLVARDENKLDVMSHDLLARGAKTVNIFKMDINDVNRHEEMLRSAISNLGEIDYVLIAHGTLPVQCVCEKNVATTLQEINTNGVNTIALLTVISNYFEDKKSGVIAVITSVAGDRGRPSNYVYGSAKSLVSTFLDGLRARLYKSNVKVIDIRPGFVSTPMTQDLDLPSLLTVAPEKIACDVVSAFDKKNGVIYTPFFWRYIMLLIKSIPSVIFNRLSL